MTRSELNEKVNEYRLNGKMKTVVHRTCSEPDIDGARKIIKENQSVCVLNIIPNPARGLFETLNEEYFESCDDIEFSNIARSELCKGLEIT